MKRHCGMIALVLGVCGCLDLAAPPPQPAVFSLTIRIDDRGSPDALAIEAVLLPGRDEGARVRPVTTPTLQVGGLTLVPIEIDERGRYVYRDSIAIDPARFRGGVVAVEPPAVASTSKFAPPIVTRTIWRSGNERLVLTAGEGLVLDIAIPVLLDDAAPGSERWTLTLTDVDRVVAVELNALGPPPSSLVVPGALIEQANSGELTGELTFLRFDSRVAADGEYVAQVLVLVTLQWLVEIQRP